MKQEYWADIEQPQIQSAKLEAHQAAREHQIAENSWLTVCRLFRQETELNEEIAHALIERVEIAADHRISITFRYRDEYLALVQRLEREWEETDA